MSTRPKIESMLPISDPYRILQVVPDAEPEVIRAAYRALALKYHPDLAAASQVRMATINDAWAILRDPASRAAVDTAMAEARRVPPPATPAMSNERRAGMPPAPTGQPSGRVLDFGRYAGWSLGQLAPVDPNYLEWLARTPIGRSYYAEIRELLTIHAATLGGSRSSANPTVGGRSRGRLRRK